MIRTLVVRLGALGDAVLTLPALAHLLARGDTVTVLGLPASWAFLPRRDRLRIEDADGPRSRGLFSGAASDATSGFDRAVVMLGNVSVADALTRAGIATTHVSPIKPGEAGEHAALRLLRGVGGTSVDAEAVRALIAPDPGGEEYDLVLHPGSGGKHKRWPADRFAALARRFRSPLILLGPAEEELTPVFDGLNVAQAWPMRQVVSLLAKAHAFVGNDSGVSHLASWLCPTLALFGPTDPKVWAPAGPRGNLLVAPEGDLSRLTVDDVAGRLA
ncbi:MAG: glycosyltransferase family 9 protein [Alphaproteobacteria bacterium]|nr:glycosyltransferase family 9 protein [Alphaproteobacteria bacterium]